MENPRKHQRRDPVGGGEGHVSTATELDISLIGLGEDPS